MIVHIKTFFDRLLGAALPQWFYNAIGIVILLSFVLSMLKLVFPKLSKYVWFSIFAITLAYLLYEIIPLWGVGPNSGGLTYAY